MNFWDFYQIIDIPYCEDVKSLLTIKNRLIIMIYSYNKYSDTKVY